VLTYADLALIVACGLVGPLLAGLPRFAPPVVVGEIAAGVVLGHTGFGLVDPVNPTLAFLASIGFALLMFVVGTALPLREPGLRGSLGTGAAIVGVAAVLALVGGYGLSLVTNLHRPAIIALLLVTSSAAIVMPALQEGRLTATRLGMITAAWVTIADIASVVILPFAVVHGSSWEVIVGGAAVTVATLAIWAGLRAARHQSWFRRYRHLSHERGWGLDLRISLLSLFVLAWIAVRIGTSILVAGFCAGAIVALVGEPKRLAWQILGIAQGFFIPLFFVVLGAQINLRALFTNPGDMFLAVALSVGIVVVHVAAARLMRLPAATGLIAAGQMGVPAAVVAVGLETGVLTAGQGAAILAATLVSVAVMAVGARGLAGRLTSDTAAGPGRGAAPQ
jgi:Kef-type K+ transport system membrane component KefB